jgi:DNA-binding NtrC family response regulator
VRELEGVLLRALTVLSPGEDIGARDLESLLAPRRGAQAKEEPFLSDERLRGRSLDELRGELERAYLAHLYRETGGDLGAMMKKLGVKRAYLYRWLRKVGLDIRNLRAGGSGSLP